MAQSTPIRGRQAGVALVVMCLLFAGLALLIGHLGPASVGVVMGAAGIGLIATPPAATVRERGQRVAVATGVAVPVLLVLAIIAFNAGGEAILDGIITVLAMTFSAALSAASALRPES